MYCLMWLYTVYTYMRKVGESTAEEKKKQTMTKICTQDTRTTIAWKWYPYRWSWNNIELISFISEGVSKNLTFTLDTVQDTIGNCLFKCTVNQETVEFLHRYTASDRINLGNRVRLRWIKWHGNRITTICLLSKCHTYDVLHRAWW